MKHIKKLLPNVVTFFMIVLLGFILVRSVSASYVLPYPSYMPGNKLYRISRILDVLSGYWHFGNIAKVKYHMALSDKYLVEAKTLFEYDQYFLAVDALRRSDMQFADIRQYIVRAQEEGKDMRNFLSLYHEESAEQTRILRLLVETTPYEFLWQPEKLPPTKLELYKEFSDAISMR